MRHIESFIHYLEEHDRSDHTIQKYADSIRKFKNWFSSDKGIEDATIIGIKEI
ncbi:MAG: site-specific integrase [Candidatus Cohnella colombiensis]|uniref:Site-specific integrase n=1 Tax=Candidatus Cohnella colombiensis TaxID=3121368 RepID=A0AA95EUH5_9BACL|nr:MAG: site-specific integrase [Cohnella sp.]